MTSLKSDKKLNIHHNLYKEYNWFYSNIFVRVQKALDEFFLKDFKLRFMGIFEEDNIFFYGDEYFVNKIPINSYSDIIIKLSSSCVSTLLDNVLGDSEDKFSLDKITDIEASLIKSFTFYISQVLDEILNKNEQNKRSLNLSKKYEFTFFLQNDNKHGGKIILNIPESILSKREEITLNENFSISNFKKIEAMFRLKAGSAKITLNEIKDIETGDIILLDDSDINFMYVELGNKKEIRFKINPNPSLIMSIDNNGDNEMEEETSVNPKNMWDSILVDIVAEFDNVKLSLGELKQISEGLVIDVGSVYENKIKLRVENQVVATGELVIINDRYGVRIDSVRKSSKDEPKKETPKKTEPNKENVQEEQESVPSEKQQNESKPNDDENFDYSDFEIEDESI